MISAMEYINRNYMHPLSLLEISDIIHTNEYYLCQLFKSTTGQTVFNYINHVRICVSEKMLTDTNSSISEIALSSGFMSVKYFDKVFKNKIGITPLQYRQQSNIQKNKINELWNFQEYVNFLWLKKGGQDIIKLPIFC